MKEYVGISKSKKLTSKIEYKGKTQRNHTYVVLLYVSG